jgi:peptidoglycan/xylan/chitin deacetylase (PgdA/CDA1 family)
VVISLTLSALLATAPALLPAANLAAVAGAGPYFALTFDAHVEAQGAEQLLALLRERGVHATIFVTGRFAQTYPTLVLRAAQDGHEIGNHTWNHPHLTTWAENHRHDTRPAVTRELLHDELRRTAAAIQAAIGRPPSPYWRAPYGEQNAAIRGWAAELGFVHVDWTRGPHDSLDALDWVEDPSEHGFMSPEGIARRLINFESKNGVPLAGSIVLMHLGSARPHPPLLEALPIFLDETDHRGLRPVPVGELLRHAAVASVARSSAHAVGAP